MGQPLVSRVRNASATADVTIDPRREVVVYWMIGARRPSWNFALDRAVDLARELDKPLLVLEPLRVGYPWASERLHAFVVDGMRDNAAAFEREGIAYHPYVEGAPGEGKGLLEAIGARACVVVTDEALGFFQPRMIDAAAARLAAVGAPLEVVDGNGLVPLRAVDKASPTAYAYRRALQKLLPRYLASTPRAEPFSGARLRAWDIPGDVARRWPAANVDALDLASLPIDHAVKRATGLAGGFVEGRARLARFVTSALDRYEDRSHPDLDVASGLSPWLHFGHVSAHEVFDAVARREAWKPSRAGHVVDGSKEGFWGMSANAEAFLDELVTWRELAHNHAVFLDNFQSDDSHPRMGARVPRQTRAGSASRALHVRAARRGAHG